LSAADTGESSEAFLESEGGGVVSIEELTSIAKRTASWTVLLLWKMDKYLASSRAI
jgi:hypothetical protein